MTNAAAKRTLASGAIEIRALADFDLRMTEPGMFARPRSARPDFGRAQ